MCFHILKVLISPGFVFHLRTVTMHGNTREMQHISCDINHFQDDLSNYQFLCQAAMTFLRNTDEGSKSWSGNMSRIILYSPRLATFTLSQNGQCRPKPQQSAITFLQVEKKNKQKNRDSVFQVQVANRVLWVC